MADNSRTTILLVEDEEQVRKMLRKIFERAGYSLLVADCGQQALQISKEHPGDITLLVSDVQMPGMTGPEVARELRLSRPDLHVLLISAYPQGMCMLDTVWHWNFLQKPFMAAIVLARVQEVLKSPPPVATFSG
jgi:CheY-like chemotaxis protein